MVEVADGVLPATVGAVVVGTSTAVVSWLPAGEVDEGVSSPSSATVELAEVLFGLDEGRVEGRDEAEAG
jgi:hypothetical protein